MDTVGILNNSIIKITMLKYYKFKNSNQVRQNDHTFYMESQREIVQQVKNMGLKLVETIDMSACNYDHQYLYIFQK